MELYRCQILGKPVTKKNSQQLAFSKKYNRSFIVQSETYKRYEKEALKTIEPPKDKISEPVNVKCTYWLHPNKDGSLPKNKPDLTNLLGATNDILVRAGVLEDDNISIIASHDGSRAIYDAGEPMRTDIVIERIEP